MTTKHLSDEILQLLASGDKPSEKDQLHLHNCPVCQDQVEAYKLLINAIADQPTPSLQFDLTAAVLEKITSKTAPAPSHSGILLPLSFLVAAVALVYVFRNELAVLFDGIAVMTISLISVSVCTLLLFFCMDIFSTYRKKIHDLDLYS